MLKYSTLIGWNYGNAFPLNVYLLFPETTRQLYPLVGTSQTWYNNKVYFSLSTPLLFCIEIYARL